ncbi:serine dehydratase [Thermoanaerobacteraceae bacterium SP2]|nr:serine dehydratase [Thermoanaerobacteraceae bacterium SP2]
MKSVKEIAQGLTYNYGHMTLGECINVAKEMHLSVGEVVIQEAIDLTGMSYNEVVNSMNDSFCHNLRAAEIGITTGSSFLLGTVGQDLYKGINGAKIVDDEFVNKIVTYTLAAQVGNHIIGLRPCAGTGDSCPYTGFVKALKEFYNDEDLIARVMAVILKVGGIFRIGKTTTGCNMEGLGAGAAATAAAFVELYGGTPEQLEKAVVLAISPTISVPCTPRVLVPGLCATHIGGAILIARLASQLAMYTNIPSTVPVDVMIAMAAQCHMVSAENVVPVTIQYMEPFFKRDTGVDEYIDPKVKDEEKQRQDAIIVKAVAESRELAERANPITSPFGDAVVGGSSEGVGSPTNCARIAHYLAKGDIKKVKVELCSELFARRAINIPGVLMAAVEGAGTDDADAYKQIMDKIKAKGIEVEILEIEEPSVQRVTIEATEQNSMVDSLNRGGARLVIRDAYPDIEKAFEIAKQLNIVVINK